MQDSFTRNIRTSYPSYSVRTEIPSADYVDKQADKPGSVPCKAGQ